MRAPVPLGTARPSSKRGWQGGRAPRQSRAPRCGTTRLGGSLAVADGGTRRPRSVRPAQWWPQQPSCGPTLRPQTASTAARPAPRAARARDTAGVGGVRPEDGLRPARRPGPRRPGTEGAEPAEARRAWAAAVTTPASNTAPEHTQADGGALPQHRAHLPRAPRRHGRATARTGAPTAPRAKEKAAEAEEDRRARLSHGAPGAAGPGAPPGPASPVG